MVSTRSSARKPPNPSRPSSAPSRLTSQPHPTPVLDDLPPPHPRRSRRIRLKNAESTSSQPALLDHPVVVVATPPNENQTTQHSDDEAPEEIKTLTVEPRIHPTHHHTSQQNINKNRRRRQRHRQRRKKDKSAPLPDSLPSQHESQLQIVTPIGEPSSPFGERLSADAITAAQSALEDAKKRRQNAKQIARLQNQVKHVGTLNRSQQIGRTKVALVSDTFPLINRPTKKGRQSAASFLTSCVQKGPKRVSASKIAITAISKSSF